MKTITTILSLVIVLSFSSCTSHKARQKQCKPADCKTVCKPVRSK